MGCLIIPPGGVLPPAGYPFMNPFGGDGLPLPLGPPIGGLLMYPGDWLERRGYGPPGMPLWFGPPN